MHPWNVRAEGEVASLLEGVVAITRSKGEEMKRLAISIVAASVTLAAVPEAEADPRLRRRAPAS